MRVDLVEVGHHFGDGLDLFSGLTLCLLPGRVHALTGPSGSGKSTLLGILARWIEPTSGRVEHRDISTIGRVFQNPHGTPRRTAVDHVALPLLAAGQGRHTAEEGARALLGDFGLSHVANSAFRSLSGGEAQRLMLARAIAAAPSLLLVDEPTAQLDPHSAATVNASLGALARDGMIVVVATHDSITRDACDEVVDLAQRV